MKKVKKLDESERGCKSRGVLGLTSKGAKLIAKKSLQLE
jgi:hypothetical protein